jgi:hypothetical protein
MHPLHYSSRRLASHFFKYQIALTVRPFPSYSPILYLQSISGKGRSTYLINDTYTVKYLTAQMTFPCCSRLRQESNSHELSDLYTFEPGKRFHD